MKKKLLIILGLGAVLGFIGLVATTSFPEDQEQVKQNIIDNAQKALDNNRKLVTEELLIGIEEYNISEEHITKSKNHYDNGKFIMKENEKPHGILTSFGVEVEEYKFPEGYDKLVNHFEGKGGPEIENPQTEDRDECGEFHNDLNPLSHCGDSYKDKSPLITSLVPHDEDSFISMICTDPDVDYCPQTYGHIGMVKCKAKDKEGRCLGNCFIALDSNHKGEGQIDAREICKNNEGIYKEEIELSNGKKIYNIITGFGYGKIQKHPNPVKQAEIEKQLAKFPELKPKKPKSNLWYVSTYYTPVRGQVKYFNGSYEADYKINCHGDCLNTASGYRLSNKDIQKVVACPSSFAFNTRLKLTYPDGFTREVVCKDRGGAIKNKRLDLWVGIGDEGYNNIGQGSSRSVQVNII